MTRGCGRGEGGEAYVVWRVIWRGGCRSLRAAFDPKRPLRMSHSCPSYTAVLLDFDPLHSDIG